MCFGLCERCWFFETVNICTSDISQVYVAFRRTVEAYWNSDGNVGRLPYNVGNSNVSKFFGGEILGSKRSLHEEVLSKYPNIVSISFPVIELFSLADARDITVAA